MSKRFVYTTSSGTTTIKGTTPAFSPLYVDTTTSADITYVVPSAYPEGLFLFSLLNTSNELVLGIRLKEGVVDVVYGDGVEPSQAAKDFFEHVVRFMLEFCLVYGGRRK